MLVGTADGDAMNPNGDVQAPTPEAAQAQQNQQPPLPTQLVQNEAKVRIEAAVAAEVGFVEAPRLVLVESLLCFRQQDRFNGRRL